MSLDLWILLGIAAAGIVRVWFERWFDRVERRAKYIRGDYA
jgi:hypothetical protein